MHRFCPQCGAGLHSRFIEEERQDRLVCSTCTFIFYQNPKIVVGVLPIHQGRVVLLRRGIEPRRGTWTFPAGYLELGETVEEGALRETWEECTLEVRLDALLNVYSRPQVGIVNIIYLATVLGGTPTPNPEALEFGEFGPDDIPWDDLAFPSTRQALHDWVRLFKDGIAPTPAAHRAARLEPGVG
jgi:ADP-ribose pyrophosphatase YjhB (NUDIX family)